MEELKRTKKEYGGFLPLELNSGEEYFVKYESNLFRYNTVKAALHELIIKLGYSKIYIPYYYCPSTAEAIKRTGIDVCYYHINERLLPIDLPDEKGSIVLLVDYFGVCEERIKRLGETIRNADVIFDFAHDFFSEPVIDKQRHNVYSAKKFFGVPDGSYLISELRLPYSKTPSLACGYSEYLIKAYEEGTNAAYLLKKEIDKKLADNYDSMSVFSRGILKNADYEHSKCQRIKNYNALRVELDDFNELELLKSCAAYQFPFLIKDSGRIVKRKLIDNHIFVSTLWTSDNLKNNGNEFELNMMNDCVFLPMDQRYSEADMAYISRFIEKIKEDCNV